MIEIVAIDGSRCKVHNTDLSGLLSELQSMGAVEASLPYSAVCLSTCASWIDDPDHSDLSVLDDNAFREFFLAANFLEAQVLIDAACTDFHRRLTQCTSINDIQSLVGHVSCWESEQDVAEAIDALPAFLDLDKKSLFDKVTGR